MTLTDRDDIAIAQLVFYIPAGGAATFLCFRHGFKKSASWNDFMAKPRLPGLVFKSLDLLSLVGLVIGTVGGIQASKSTDRLTTVDPKSKAAVAIFLAIFVFDVLILGYLAVSMSRIEASERRILPGVAASFPFVFVRLLYAMIYDFSGDQDFNSITGSIAIYVCMSVVMEFIAVIICLVMGFSLRVRRKKDEAEKTPA
ncbi:hypothetical protein DIS24_g10259 [Lasiodiplodia hormozganensis]|uniref:DUF7702 domain-containing protein n=1 Tax=Lasiodiplodia hormozganensis TaxID=869390 RepID=A0AA39XPV8_9PEZI|nr:hypothetical protein DIS24_g10259 [Lasiodiplodia hormozganensis]